MSSALETAVVAVVAVVIFYVLLGAVLTFTWNRSVTKVFNTLPMDLTQSIFLLITMNILFGSVTQSSLSVYHNSSNNANNAN